MAQPAAKRARHIDGLLEVRRLRRVQIIAVLNAVQRAKAEDEARIYFQIGCYKGSVHKVYDLIIVVVIVVVSSGSFNSNG